MGSRAAVRRRLGGVARTIDCGGATVLPGLIDPHVHLYGLATASAHLSLGGYRRARELLEAVATCAAALAPGSWIRGEGLDEQCLDRLPTPAELDRAAPRHPVRLRHRSRHASLLSGRAVRWLARRGLVLPDHGGGLVGGHDRAISATIGPLPAATLEAGLVAVGESLLALGVTTVGDATPRPRRGWTPLVRLIRSGRFGVRVVAMRPVGAPLWPTRGCVVAGPVKILVEEGPDGLMPSPAALAALVARAARGGDAVAVHCVGEATLVAALAAFAALPRAQRRLGHRLEHVGVCPPPLVAEIARLGLAVVTNPAFLYWRGDVYRRETPPERWSWLYRGRSLAEAGVPLAAASDAPVMPPDPWRTVASARSRRTRRGAVLGSRERLDARAALALVTTGAAAALGCAHAGRLVPGAWGDAVLVARDPLRASAVDVARTRPLLTIAGGEVAWRR